MVLTHPFLCPVNVVEGHGFAESIAGVVAGRSWVLITSAGWIRRGVVDKLAPRTGHPVAVIDSIQPNPKLPDICLSARDLPQADCIVAIGGGSVLDAAKAIAVLAALGGDEGALREHLIRGTPLPDSLLPRPIIAVPTTAGTGSEVTRWGTIWGDDDLKYSVTDRRLYPTHAILDPALCVSMPADTTLATALDALSHAMEAVWNRRHTALTDFLAESAIRTIYRALPLALRDPTDLNFRRDLQTASVIAGLAMGTTQTALAHSISYPFTALFGMPHGFACSFTLAEVARYNLAEGADRFLPIATALACDPADLPAFLAAWFTELDLASRIGRYADITVVDKLGDNLITRARAANNIRDVDGVAAREIVRAALRQMLHGAERTHAA